MTPTRTTSQANGSGKTTYDPSQNVKDLMEASIQALTERQDLLARVSDEKVRRLEVEVAGADKLATLRAEHNAEIREMESDRIDKIRSVDVANAASTAAQLLSAVQNLERTAAQTAETLRNQVASTAQAAIISQASLINPIVERVAVLEKSSYTGAGRSAISDPALAELVQEIKGIRQTQSVGAGKQEGIGTSATVMMGLVTVIAALLGIAGVLYAVLKPTVAP